MNEEKIMFPKFDGEMVYDPSPQKNNKGYIYFIFNQVDELIYIGKSINLLSRFGFHTRGKKTKYTCKYIIVPLEILSEEEAEYILKFKPTENNAISPNNRWLTISTFMFKNPQLKGKRVKIKKMIAKEKIKDLHDYYHIKDLRKVIEHFEVDHGIN